MSIGSILAEQLDGTRAWTLKLLADISDQDWTFAPAPGLAHPLWLCGHLAVSQSLLVHVRVLNRAPIVPDAFAAKFPIGGPVPSAGEGGYPSVAEVREMMDRTHAATLEAIRPLTEDFLREPAYGKDGAPHPHYRDKLGAITHCERHEAFHAGQLALIRRLMGKNFLR
jgi:hypothetical protein